MPWVRSDAAAMAVWVMEALFALPLKYNTTGPLTADLLHNVTRGEGSKIVRLYRGVGNLLTYSQILLLYYTGAGVRFL